MKKLLLIYLVPVVLTITCLLLVIPATLEFLPQEQTVQMDTFPRYLPNFKNYPIYENQFLNNNKATIFILGSSELSENTKAVPYNFISDHFKTALKGVGHAGNQCFSIYSQLLANENRLKNAPIVIVLSPGWFHSIAANGTTSSLFLEFNSSKFLTRILQNEVDTIFRQYETTRLADFFEELVNPDLTLKLLFFQGQASKSSLHNVVYSPIIALDKVLTQLRFNLLETHVEKTKTIIVNKPKSGELVAINWDSLFIVSKQEQVNNSSNNSWCIDNNYYSEYVKGRTTHVSPVNDKSNQELGDFRMLVKLLKAKKVNASFIVLPLNPYYYTNAKELDPLIHTLTTELTQQQFPYLNLWNSDSTTFEKGILKDVMHLSDYGWYKADKFIIKTYALAK